MSVPVRCRLSQSAMAQLLFPTSGGRSITDMVGDPTVMIGHRALRGPTLFISNHYFWLPRLLQLTNDVDRLLW